MAKRAGTFTHTEFQIHDTETPYSTKIGWSRHDQHRDVPRVPILGRNHPGWYGTVPLIEDRLKLAGLAGLDARCASVRASGLAVLELESEPERAIEAIVQQAELAVQQDRAEVICLGCGGMAGLDDEIRARTGVPLVEGVSAAVTIAESLVRLGLTTSKVRTFAPPRPKTVIGWPL